MITVLAGGVGAARFLAGLVQIVEPAEITAIVNVGDDTEVHGLHVSPDIDTVIYTLAGAVNPETGWGLADETWQAMDLLAQLGGPAWFRLGDRDLGSHLRRTGRLAEGASLSVVTAELARSWGLGLRVLPVTDDRVRTIVTLSGGGEVPFQDYFVRLQHSVPVSAVRFEGADSAAPAPGALAALDDADVVVIAPSNPIVSIAPLLAVAGVRDAVARRRDRTVAVSPIVAGEAIKGPAARLLHELGHESSVTGVARLYAPLADALVIDVADEDRSVDVRAAGMRPVVTPTIMHDSSAAAALADATLAAVGDRR